MTDSINGHLLAIDIGGTFTDLVLLDPSADALVASKVLTTYPDPSAGVLAGVQDLFEEWQVEAGSVGRIVHGTTLITNALIERKGSRTGLITTAGFRDALEIGREGRYDIAILNDLKDSSGGSSRSPILRLSASICGSPRKSCRTAIYTTCSSSGPRPWSSGGGKCRSGWMRAERC